MSAHKRALLTPDAAALRRLDDLAAQLRATSRPDPGAERAARQAAMEQVAAAVTHSEQRQALVSTRLEESLGGMDNRMAQLERATGQALRAQAEQLQAQLRAELRRSGGALAAHTQSLLAGQAEQYAHLLGQVQAERQALGETLYAQGEALRQQQEQFQALDYSLRAQEEHLRSQEDRLRAQGDYLLAQQGQRQAAGSAAESAIRQAQALLSALAQAYPPPAHGWEGLQTQLEQAHANLAGGYTEAALATAQQASFRLGELRIGLEQELSERSLLQASALEQAQQVQALLEANRVVNAIDLEGRSLDLPLEVDYWTGGGWSLQRQALAEALDYLDQPLEALAQGDLLGLVQSYLASIARAVPELVAAARRAALASQLRYNLAEAVLSALGEQGFALEQASYLSGDMRQAYQLALHNLEGSQLVVTLAPQADEVQPGVKHLLDLHSLDQAQRTPHELRQRASELARSLRRYGLQVSTPGSEGGAVSYPLPARPRPAQYQVAEKAESYSTTKTLRH